MLFICQTFNNLQLTKIAFKAQNSRDLSYISSMVEPQNKIPETNSGPSSILKTHSQYSHRITSRSQIFRAMVCAAQLPSGERIKSYIDALSVHSVVCRTSPVSFSVRATV
jgi:hypothetical protein